MTRQRIQTRQVYVILDDHEVARGEIAANSASGIGCEVNRRPMRMHYANRESGKPRRVSLVHVKPAGQRNDVASAELSMDEGTRMPLYSRGGKPWNFSERDPLRIFDLVCKTAKP